MEHAIWLATQGKKDKSGDVNRSGRGRAGGLYERAEANDRQEWNSDDEQIDEFGRRKKRRTGSKVEKISGSAKGSTDEGRQSRAEDNKPPSRLASSSRATAMPAWSSNLDFRSFEGYAPAMSTTSMATATATPAASAPSAASDAALQVLLQKMPKEAAERALKRQSPNQTQLLTERQQGGGKRFIPPKPISGSSLTCKFFAEGFCTWGNRCNFIHNPMDQLKKMEGFVDFETGLPKECVKKGMSHPKESNDKVTVSTDGTIRLKAYDHCSQGPTGQHDTSPSSQAIARAEHQRLGSDSTSAKPAVPMKVAAVPTSSSLPLAFQKRLKKLNV